MPQRPRPGRTALTPPSRQQHQQQQQQGHAAQPHEGGSAPADAETQAVQVWAHDIDVLYSLYVIARAARSLREDDASRRGDHA